MQMYVNYYDRYEKIEGENPTIGILLCKQSDEALVDLTLPSNANIYAKEYKLYLPSEEELLRELNQEYRALEAGKTDEEGQGKIFWALYQCRCSERYDRIDP